MGKYLFDQYTYLHFAVGVVVYYWGIKLTHWVILHMIFEILENTTIVMKLINKIKIWPGGKPYSDSLTNIIGDNIGTIFGWLSAYYLDNLGSKYGYYTKHIK